MSDLDIETGYAPSSDGTQLLFRWHPVAGARSLVVVVHGFGEHSGRYLHVMDALNEAGHACLTIDLRGHGRSGGRRAFVERFSDYLDDVDAAVGLARERMAEGELFLIGHSMGGLVVASWIAERGDQATGFVLSSPAMGVALPVPGWKDALGRVMSHLLPGLAIPTGLDPNLVSRDPTVVEAYVGDRLILTRATARWYVEFLAAQAQALARAATVTKPALVMQAGLDGLVDPTASERYAGALGGEDVTFSRYEGLYHELFNEPEQREVLAAVAEWLDTRSSPK
ncbi:MAG: alpha/beta hydrolase [Myxococcota bacterium]|nr:alpha/beta hydrolase [Myxococcota bacterium]